METSDVVRYQIGELARCTGVPAKTIRYYETRALLPAPARTDAGYRLYGDEDVRRLEFIKRAKTLGFSLDEIHSILALRDRGTPPCPHVVGLLDQKLAEVHQRQRTLAELEQELASLRETAERIPWDPEAACYCTILERAPIAPGSSIE